MNKIKNKLIGFTLALVVILNSGLAIVSAEEASVNTDSINTIQIEATTTNSNASTTGTINESTTEQTTTSNYKDTKHLKDDLYDGNILIDDGATIDGVFEKLIVKGRELVENVRKAVIPYLILAWIILFAVSILRVLTGERGASSRLVGGLLLITIAYCGIVYAEVFITSMVKFFVA